MRPIGQMPGKVPGSSCPFSHVRTGPPLDEHALFCVSALWGFFEERAEEIGTKAFRQFVDLRAASDNQQEGSGGGCQMSSELLMCAKEFTTTIGQAITGYKGDAVRLAKQLHDLATNLAMHEIKASELELVFDCFRSAIREAIGAVWSDDVGDVLSRTFASFLGIMEPALSTMTILGSKASFLSSQSVAMSIESVDEESKELVRYSWGMVTDYEALSFGMYVHMFRISPTTLNLFSFKDEILASEPDGLKRHSEKFAKELGFLIKRMDSPVTFVAAIRGLATGHCKHAVLPGHLPFMGKALLKTLEGLLGAAWSARLEQAWRLVWDAIASCFSQCLSVEEGMLKMHQLHARFAPQEAPEHAGVVQFNTKTHAVHAVFAATRQPSLAPPGKLQRLLSSFVAHADDASAEHVDSTSHSASNTSLNAGNTHNAARTDGTAHEDPQAAQPGDIKVCFAGACHLYAHTPEGNVQLVSCPYAFGSDRLGLSIVAAGTTVPVLLVYNQAKACYINTRIDSAGVMVHHVVTDASPFSCTCAGADGAVYSVQVQGSQDHTHFLAAVEKCRPPPPSPTMDEGGDTRQVGAKYSLPRARSNRGDVGSQEVAKRSRALPERSTLGGGGGGGRSQVHFATLCLLYELGPNGWALAHSQRPFDVNGELCVAIVSGGGGGRRVAVYDRESAVVMSAPVGEVGDSVRMCSGGAEVVTLDCNDKRWTVQMALGSDVIRFGVAAFGELRLVVPCPLEAHHSESLGNSVGGPGSLTVSMGSIGHVVPTGGVTGLTVTLNQATLQSDLETLRLKQQEQAARRSPAPAPASCPRAQAGGGEWGCARATRRGDSFEREKREPFGNPELSVEVPRRVVEGEDKLLDLGAGMPARSIVGIPKHGTSEFRDGEDQFELHAGMPIRSPGLQKYTYVTVRRESAPIDKSPMEIFQGSFRRLPTT